MPSSAHSMEPEVRRELIALMSSRQPSNSAAVLVRLGACGRTTMGMPRPLPSSANASSSETSSPMKMGTAVAVSKAKIDNGHGQKLIIHDIALQVAEASGGCSYPSER